MLLVHHLLVQCWPAQVYLQPVVEPLVLPVEELVVRCLAVSVHLQLGLQQSDHSACSEDPVAVVQGVFLWQLQWLYVLVECAVWKIKTKSYM